MLAQSLKVYLDKIGIHYSWVMAAMVFLFTLATSSIGNAPQILILPITEAHGWNISDVSLATGLMYLMTALLCPIGAPLMLRIGVINVVLIVIFLEILGLLCTVLAYEKWHLLFSIGLCLGIASGIIGLGLAATVATRWFTARRGLVVGIMTSAFAAGQLIFMPLMAWITTVYNWQFAIAPGLAGGIICGVLFLLFGKDWPSQLKLPAYGDDEIYHPPTNNPDNAVTISVKALLGAINHPAFWVLTVTFFICGLTSTGIVGQHFIPFCADNNVGIIMASSYLALMGFFNFIGTMGSGWLSDRYNNYTLLAIYYGLRGVSLFYLPYSNFDIYSLTLWAIFFGLDFIATVPPTVKLSGKFFGTVNGPIVFGWIFGAHQLGSAVAAYGTGLSRDILSTYVPAFLLAGLSCFIATTLFLYLLSFRPKFSH